MSVAPTWSLKTAAKHDDDASLMPYLFYTLLLALWITLLAVFYGVMSDTVNRAEKHQRDSADRALAFSRCDWKISSEARSQCRAELAGPQQSELPSLSSDIEPSLNLAYR
ncbi:MAG TPA: hypothetical protein H9903_01880 [Candidatus Aquabacterium excrementipullorum]|nr:hypothetical protein [Candidatus Aquabacterium excrementipullorum]